MVSELDEFFPRVDPATRELGLVIGGSLSRGLEVKLNLTAPVEEMAVGRYITIEGSQLKFFGMITDVVLDNTNQALMPGPLRGPPVRCLARQPDDGGCSGRRGARSEAPAENGRIRGSTRCPHP